MLVGALIPVSFRSFITTDIPSSFLLFQLRRSCEQIRGGDEDRAQRAPLLAACQGAHLPRASTGKTLYCALNYAEAFI